MKHSLLLLFLIGTLCQVAAGGSVSGISDATEIAAALAQAGPGDTLTLDADFEWNGPEVLAIPSGVTLDGDGHTITSTLDSGGMLSQSGTSAVVCRNLGLFTTSHLSWAISVGDGDLRLENCNIRCRMIAWANGAITLEGCAYTLQLPAGSDFSEPIGIFGGGAALTATNCLFRIGWDVQHVDGGFFHNFGGSPASSLSVSHCTVIGGPDPNYNQGSRHQSVFVSDNTAGPSYLTLVTDSIITAEVVSVFHSRETGQIISSHNNNAGMIRNPGIMAGGDTDGPRFYQRDPDDTPVSDRTGDIEEPNPFVDAANGDFRLVDGSLSATGASDGGPMGVELEVIPKELNAYNLDLRIFVSVEHRTTGYTEALFDGWPVRRDSNQQISLLLEEGPCGPAMRLEAMNTGGGTTVQNAYQSFVTIPGWQYTLRASARRSAIEPVGTWEDNGVHAHAILGVANGISPDPGILIASAPLDGPENQWLMGQLVVTASSNRLTVHLIHSTDGSWNRVDWDDVRVTGRAPVGAPVPSGLEGPVLAYINTILPESEADRAERHQRVAGRRGSVPIIVHRGASRFDPENTLEAYARTIELGGDGVEFDPRKTKDGVLYTFHDATVDRMLQGSGRGDQMTYYQLASLPFRNLKGRATEETRVPTIVSLFELAREHAMLLHFDVKEQGIENLLIGMLDRLDMWDHMVFVTPASTSDRLRFHPNARLMTYKENNPDWSNPEDVARFMAGPGDMIFMTEDPSPAVSALGREVPGYQPLPERLRAWWWPDGASLPAGEVGSSKPFFWLD